VEPPVPGGEVRLDVKDWIVPSEEKFDLVSNGENVQRMRRRTTGEVIEIRSCGAARNSGRSAKDIQNAFIEEMKALVILRHPCIQSLRGCYFPTATSGPKLITECLEGLPLQTVMSSKERSWTPTRRVIAILSIVLGMIDLHEAGMLHENLSPEKILVDDDGHVKITGFGRFGSDKKSATVYSAPEVLRGEWNQYSDVYAFGLILYDIAADVSYFSKPKNKQECFDSMQKGERPVIPVTVLPVTQDLINKCWAQNCDARPSFADILNQIERAEFQIISGVRLSDIRAFLYWINIEKNELMW
jgi:serine/threonine protein kinase